MEHLFLRVSYITYSRCTPRIPAANKSKTKKTPTNPWNVPKTLNDPFMKEILSYLCAHSGDTFQVIGSTSTMFCLLSCLQPNNIGNTPQKIHNTNPFPFQLGDFRFHVNVLCQYYLRAIMNHLSYPTFRSTAPSNVSPLKAPFFHADRFALKHSSHTLKSQ